jgi:hypothetical protein
VDWEDCTGGDCTGGFVTQVRGAIFVTMGTKFKHHLLEFLKVSEQFLKSYRRQVATKRGASALCRQVMHTPHVTIITVVRRAQFVPWARVTVAGFRFRAIGCRPRALRTPSFRNRHWLLGVIT